MTTETNADLIEKAINELETNTLLYFNTGVDRMFDRVTEAKETIKGIVDCQQEEIGRLREALEFYADKTNYKTFDSSAIKDSGRIARRALTGVTNGSEA